MKPAVVLDKSPAQPKLVPVPVRMGGEAQAASRVGSTALLPIVATAPEKPSRVREKQPFSVARMCSDILSPLSGGWARQEPWLCLGLALFLTWLCFWGLPGPARALSLVSFQGAVYLALLVPASVMASCLVLWVGCQAGKAIARKATK